MILHPTSVEDVKKNREEWATALTSGKYRQGQGRLHDNIPDAGIETFCCLGVGCDISGIGEWDSEFYRWSPSEYVEGNWSDSSTFYQAFGISLAQEDDLISANDNGVPFTEIAAMIRSLPLPESVTP